MDLGDGLKIWEFRKGNSFHRKDIVVGDALEHPGDIHL